MTAPEVVPVDRFHLWVAWIKPVEVIVQSEVGLATQLSGDSQEAEGFQPKIMSGKVVNGGIHQEHTAHAGHCVRCSGELQQENCRGGDGGASQSYRAGRVC